MNTLSLIKSELEYIIENETLEMNLNRQQMNKELFGYFDDRVRHDKKNPNYDLAKWLDDHVDDFIIYKPSNNPNKQVEIVFDRDNSNEFKKEFAKFNVPCKIDSQGHTIFIINKIKIRSTGKKNANSSGKALADAGERATIKSLQGVQFNSVQDTEEPLFINNPEWYSAWQNTFLLSRNALKGYIGFDPANAYKIIHDATPGDTVRDLIHNIVKLSKVAKDSWCPADVWIFKTHECYSQIQSKLKTYLKTCRENTEIKGINILVGLSNILGKYITDRVGMGELIPVSLKQIKTSAKCISIDARNKKYPDYDCEIQHFNCDLNPHNGKEIGLFYFLNKKTNNKITMQVRGFPHGYTIAQTEITSDGSETGGRVGKVPTYTIDFLTGEEPVDYLNNSRLIDVPRINSIEYFGRAQKEEYFTTFNNAKINEVYSWFEFIQKHPKVNVVRYTKEEFIRDIEEAKHDPELAANLCIKIQGLRMMKFFVINEINRKQLSHTSFIIQRMVMSALKMDKFCLPYVKLF